MLRILHIHSGNLFGGVERVLLSLTGVEAAIVPISHDYALCFSGPLRTGLEARGRPSHVLGEVQVRKPWTILRARRRLRELLQRERFDVVLVHSAWAQAIFGSTVRATGCAQVFWVHDTVDGRHWLQRWSRRHEPDLAVCSSHFIASLVPRLYPHVRTEVIYCPLEHVAENDPLARSAVRADLGAPEDETVIVQIGRLEPWKGHRMLLESLASLRETPGWTCWLVGGVQREEEGEYLRGLETMARRFGIEGRVRFLGQRNDVSRILAAADIYCQPNTEPEPFGLTFIEAMYAGLPIVTAGFGGGLEVVDGYGFLFAPGNATELSGLLGSLIADVELRSSTAVEGPKRARSLTDPTAQCTRLHDVLTKLVVQRAGAT